MDTEEPLTQLLIDKWHAIPDSTWSRYCRYNGWPSSWAEVIPSQVQEAIDWIDRVQKNPLWPLIQEGVNSEEGT